MGRIIALVNAYGEAIEEARRNPVVRDLAEDEKELKGRVHFLGRVLLGFAIFAALYWMAVMR